MNDVDFTKLHDAYASIYKHPKHKRHNMSNRVIAFDLDETLGSFVDLDVLWQILQGSGGTVDFFELADLYPEFLRTGILSILEYLKQKKQNNECGSIYLYTNNQSSANWPQQIARYLDYKLNMAKPLFDQIILAFMINDSKVELARTTHNKTYDDFIRCTMLPKSTVISFIDNSFFDDMVHRRIYYIQPRSYYHCLSKRDIIDRFLASPLAKKCPPNIGLTLNWQMSEFEPSPNNAHVDTIVAQKIMYHLKEFFFLMKQKVRTRKIRYLYGKMTRRKRK